MVADPSPGAAWAIWGGEGTDRLTVVAVGCGAGGGGGGGGGTLVGVAVGIGDAVAIGVGVGVGAPGWTARPSTSSGRCEVSR